MWEKNTIVRALRVLKNYSKRGSIFFKQAWVFSPSPSLSNKVKLELLSFANIIQYTSSAWGLASYLSYR